MRRGSRKTDFSGIRVDSIPLSETRPGLRLAAAIAALLMGAATISFTVVRAVNKGKGWNTVETTDAETAAALELSFRYDLERGEKSVSALNKELSRIYTKATDCMYQLLDISAEYEGITNLCTLNLHPNAEYTVEPVLYEALEKLTGSSELLYLGPVMEEYRAMFSSEDSEEAARFDPLTDPESAEYVAGVMEYLKKGAVELEFGEADTVCLRISDDFLKYAEEREISVFLDPGILADALILDYAAELLIGAGYTNGVLSSVSGFTRVLSPQVPISVNIFTRSGNMISFAGTETFSGLSSALVLRSFPLSSSEYWYADLGDGEIRNAFIDLSDGLCKAAADYMLVTSEELSCTEAALLSLPLYASDELSEEKLGEARGAGIEIKLY